MTLVTAGAEEKSYQNGLAKHGRMMRMLRNSAGKLKLVPAAEVRCLSGGDRRDP